MLIVSLRQLHGLPSLIMYMTIIISMYDPNEMEALTSMLKLLPEDLMKAMDFSNVVTDLTGYLASWLYELYSYVS
ncbi:ABC transporter permease [Clostridium tetanomorphum DSM 665]|nr:ABC transporter permease [Clostridium tetanomorphum DSM 665]